MSHIPQVSGARVVRALMKAGFIVLRQSGSHVIMRHTVDLSKRAIIPVHGSRSVKTGTLRAILRGIKMSVEEFGDLVT